MKFRVHNEEHSEAIQKRLFEMGFEWPVGGTEFTSKATHLFAEGVITLIDDGDEKYFTEHITKESTLGDLYKLPTTTKVKLNDEFTAEIYDDKVVVGCQEFTHKSIKRLYKKLKEFQDD